jgi:uncharacterized RDD family membrane protein YckC
MNMITEPAFPSPEPGVSIPEVKGKKFMPRAGAYVIDSLILYGLNYAASYGFSYLIGIFLTLIAPIFGSDYYFVTADFTCINYIVGAVQTIVYFGLFEWLFGRSPGKVILGMRVVSSDGGAVNFKQAFIRSVYRLIDGLFFGVVAASTMKPPEFQRLGDKKASTLVVSSKDPIIKDNPSWWKFVIALAGYLCLEFVIVAMEIFFLIRFA